MSVPDRVLQVEGGGVMIESNKRLKDIPMCPYAQGEACICGKTPCKCGGHCIHSDIRRNLEAKRERLQKERTKVGVGGIAFDFLTGQIALIDWWLSEDKV